MELRPCTWVRPRLSLMAGDDLNGPDRRLVERHLARCAGCRSHLASLRESLHALHQVAEADSVRGDVMSASLWPALERQIRESRRPAPAWGRMRDWQMPGRRTLVAAAMVVLMIGTAAGVGARHFDLGLARRPVAAPVRSITRDSAPPRLLKLPQDDLARRGGAPVRRKPARESVAASARASNVPVNFPATRRGSEAPGAQ